MQLRENALIFLLLFAAVVACYVTVLNAGFVWDDEYLVLRNPLLRAPLWSGQIFKQDIINSSFTYTIYYRPVQILSYAVDYRGWGMNPFGFHFSSILLHFLNGAVVFLLVQKLTGEKVVALLAALFFVIHPAHAGAVSYISGRADLLFFFFGLLAGLFYILFRERKRPILLAASAAFFALSLLSKEAAIVFPFLILFMDAVILSKKHPFKVVYHVPNFMIAGGGLVLHHLLFGARYAAVFKPGEFAENLSGYLRMAGEFLVQSIFPFGLYFRKSASGAGPELWALILIGGCFIFFVFYLKDRRGMLLFSAGFFLIALAPLIFVVGYFKVLGEHWMYLASFGIFLFLALAIKGLWDKGRVIEKAVAVVMVFLGTFFYSSITLGQNVHWRDDVALSDRVLASSARDFPAMHFKAVSFLKGGMTARSLEVMDEYVKKSPRDLRARYIKGRLALAAGNADEAERDFKQALNINPDYDNAYLGLALVALLKGEQREGEGLLEKAIEINPRNSEAFFLLGVVYSRAGETEKAFEIAKKAREINPYDFNSIVNLGTAYTRRGDLRKGARLYLEATRLYPEKPVSYHNLGYVFYISGQKEEAEGWLRQAVMVDPDFKPALELLGKMQKESAD